MNVPNTENLIEILNRSVVLNRSSGNRNECDICCYTKDGFSAAGNLIEIAIETKNVKLLMYVFKKTKQLVANTDKLDTQTCQEIIKQQDVFNGIVVKNFALNSSFVMQVMLPYMSKVR